MLLTAFFLLGFALGLSPLSRRSLESLWRAALSWWAQARGIETLEMNEREMTGLLERHVPKNHKPRLRRAK